MLSFSARDRARGDRSTPDASRRFETRRAHADRARDHARCASLPRAAFAPAALGFARERARLAPPRSRVRPRGRAARSRAASGARVATCVADERRGGAGNNGATSALVRGKLNPEKSTWIFFWVRHSRRSN
eukprot:29150-Pelagococcus_subviridis.AAC.6